MYLTINTATGRPMPAGIVPQLARGPDPSTIQFVTSNVAVLLPDGAPLALKLYTMDDAAVPKTVITDWVVNAGFKLYEAVLNALEGDLAWTKQKQLLARISYGSPNVDTPLFPIGFDSGAVSGEIVQPIVINVGTASPAIFPPAFVEISTGAKRLKLLSASAADVGNILQGTVGGEMKNYQVTAGDDAEDLPAIVRPANFHASTSPYLFVQI